MFVYFINFCDEKSRCMNVRYIICVCVCVFLKTKCGKIWGGFMPIFRNSLNQSRHHNINVFRLRHAFGIMAYMAGIC